MKFKKGKAVEKPFRAGLNQTPVGLINLRVVRSIGWMVRISHVFPARWSRRNAFDRNIGDMIISARCRRNSLPWREQDRDASRTRTWKNVEKGARRLIEIQAARCSNIATERSIFPLVLWYPLDRFASLPLQRVSTDFSSPGVERQTGGRLVLRIN